MAQNAQKDTTHSLRERNVVIASRPNTNKWQMRIKKPTSEWEFRNSKTADLDEAKQRAMDRYDELKFRQKHYLPVYLAAWRTVKLFLTTRPRLMLGRSMK